MVFTGHEFAEGGNFIANTLQQQKIKASFFFTGDFYNNLLGIELHEPDEYTEFQSNVAVYHDDYGDYSTNEPTMDGTASLIYLLAAKEAQSKIKK